MNLATRPAIKLARRLGRLQAYPLSLWERAGCQRSVWLRATPLFSDARGFTLVETLVGLAILTAVTGFLGSGLYQAGTVQRFWQDDAMATKEWRHAGSWFSRDSLKAQSTSLADGAAAVGTVTLSWTRAGVGHTAAYSLSGSNLQRVYDGGSPIIVARGVTAASFARAGRVLTFQLTVEADQGSTEQMTLDTYLRTVQP